MTISATNWYHVGKLDILFQSLDPPLISRMFLDTTWQLCTCTLLLVSRICMPGVRKIDTRTETDRALNAIYRGITGCLKPTNVNSLNALAGVAPPNTRKATATSSVISLPPLCVRQRERF